MSETTQAELLKSQTNAREPLNSKYLSELEEQKEEEAKHLITREKLPGTPFWLITRETDVIIVFGKMKINQTELKNREEAIDFINENMWNIVVMIAIGIKEQNI